MDAGISLSTLTYMCKCDATRPAATLTVHFLRFEYVGEELWGGRYLQSYYFSIKDGHVTLYKMTERTDVVLVQWLAMSFGNKGRIGNNQ